MREYISMAEIDQSRREKGNPYFGVSEETFPESPVRLGIFVDHTGQMHKFYITACKEKGISFRVFDLTDPDNLLERLSLDDCDCYLVWPSSGSTIVKEFFDYRLYIIETCLRKRIFPTWKECWLTEHKPRLRDWLDANGFPHPNTWVFYSKTRALSFANSATLPLVAKTATGASASGISVLRTRKDLIAIIQKAFGRGLRPRGHDTHDRQWGFIYLQEFFPDVHEWRMVRIGDSYFGYRKEKGPSGLHSASHKWSWLDPGQKRLDLLREITERGGFKSMDIDLFEKPDGTLLVNELQTVFGCWTPEIQMKVNDIEGRYLFEDGIWTFEAGNFCSNQMCNLRLDYIIDSIVSKKSS